MHELSIALSIVEMATEEAARLGVRVNAIHLKLGALSGVVKDALLFSYDLATEGTALTGSRLIIEEVPAVVYCTACDANRVIDSVQNFRCSVCNAPASQIVGGKELEVAALEIRE
jgi:hydrogenase nickel incorporation protein HypA/HybF